MAHLHCIFPHGELWMPQEVHVFNKESQGPQQKAGKGAIQFSAKAKLHLCTRMAQTASDFIISRRGLRVFFFTLREWYYSQAFKMRELG